MLAGLQLGIDPASWMVWLAGREHKELTWVSTLFAGQTGLEKAKRLVSDYKTGKIEHMNPELWRAKKIVDSTLHPGKRTHCIAKNCGLEVNKCE